jgi:hypothetical protein
MLLTDVVEHVLEGKYWRTAMCTLEDSDLCIGIAEMFI